ncbi:restriction endonuclease subunit S [Lactobacillus helveticus]|uniref:restriction endonuclease subunit S n=4 Tax=Lactobacillus helveticus TaxID=1587 RepID=UPI0009A19BE4|nr:restriction endonuclease subunit S [Lactobacillus helveticus]AQY53530.1 restriction endonuclease subunit S [Lactobacillus helveticus]URN37901.1 restriction endonuclease subunit S [Lactobacillus helveticus]
MNKKEVKKAPALRFKGFTNDWEERKLGDLSQDTIGGGTPKTSVTEFWNGEIPWIQSSDLANDKLYGVLPKKFITEDAVKNSATKLIPANSIAIVTRVGVGKLAFMPYEFASSQDFLSLSNLQVDCNFGMYSIYKMLQRELNNIQGTSIKGITKADLLDKETFVPIKVEEQQKIGSFFKQLDDTIALQQRKLKLLKVMKKALSQYMFCQETEFVPILRFNSFSDKWKYERLKKLIIKEIKGKAKADMKGTKSTYIDTALLNGGSITKVDSPTDTFHNDIIILWDGSQAGKIYHGFTGALGSTLKSYKPKYSGGFLYQYLKSKEPIIFLRYRTPNIPHVVKDFTEIFKINVPSVKEQEKISKTLNYLDQSILVETKKIGSIKKIKKFLLQNMFI